MDERQAQARAEIGHTDVGRGTAAGLAGLFLLAVLAVPVWQLAHEAASGEGGTAPARFVEGLPAVARTLEEEGLVAANRALLARMTELERGLERESRFAEGLLPWSQWLLAGPLATGNEQVYRGRGGWLFYRPAVDHLTGPGFLTRRHQERRRASAEAWREPPQPDPVAALLDVQRQLAARGIGLLVVPAPGKGSIHPERLTRRGRGVSQPLANPSSAELVRRLAAAGVEVLDPAPILFAGRARGDRYLKTDSHWRPEAMAEVAEALAARVAARLGLPRREGPAPYQRRRQRVGNLGDLTRMLSLPPGQGLYPPEEVEIRPVVDLQGRLWRPDPGAEILLLGDSFTNVYSQADLGWGTGAGLAEQVGFFLGRPLDLIALNAGGSHAAREVLQRQPARLRGKRLVIYQFAARELSFGDWKILDLGPATATPGGG